MTLVLSESKKKKKKESLDLMKAYLGGEAGDEASPEENRLKRKRDRSHSVKVFEPLIVDS